MRKRQAEPKSCVSCQFLLELLYYLPLAGQQYFVETRLTTLALQLPLLITFLWQFTRTEAKYRKAN